MLLSDHQFKIYSFTCLCLWENDCRKIHSCLQNRTESLEKILKQILAQSPKRVQQARDNYQGDLTRLLGTRGRNNVVCKWKGKSLIPPGMKHVTAVEEKEKRIFFDYWFPQNHRQ